MGDCRSQGTILFWSIGSNQIDKRPRLSGPIPVLLSFRKAEKPILYFVNPTTDNKQTCFL